MNIRPADIKDLEAIRKLNTAIMEETNQACDDDLVSTFAETDEGRKYFEEAINRQDGCFFVAEENGSLVGYVNGGAMELPYRRSRYFQMENLGVIPTLKRKGLGSELLETATKWAKDHGYQKIYIESYIENEGAVAFYKKHGYQAIDISLEKKI